MDHAAVLPAGYGRGGRTLSHTAVLHRQFEADDALTLGQGRLLGHLEALDVEVDNFDRCFNATARQRDVNGAVREYQGKIARIITQIRRCVIHVDVGRAAGRNRKHGRRG